MNNYDPFDAEGNEKQQKRDSRRAKRYNDRVTVKQHNASQTNINVRRYKQTEVFGEKKKRVNIFAILFFLFLGIFLFGEDIVWSIEDAIDKYKVNHVEVVEDYVFDAGDINTDHLDEAYLDLKPGMGKSLTLTQDNTDLEIDKYGDYNTTLEVGSDIEPGIYTITMSGDINIHPENLLGSYYSYEDEGETIVYNVPLITEEAFNIESREKINTYEIKLDKQEDYKVYEDGNQGLFIYGLSNFSPSVYFENGMDVEYTYNSKDDEAVIYRPNYQEEFEAKGSPGSYFIVE